MGADLAEPTRSATAAWTCAALIVLAGVTYLVSDHRAVRAIAYLGANLVVLVAVALRARRSGPLSQGPWGLLLASYGLYTLASVPWYLLPIYGTAPPVPSPIDVGFLLSYVGFALVLHRLSQGYAAVDPRGWVEVAIVTLGLSAPLWELTHPDGHELSLVTQVTLVAYPAMTLLLFAVGLRLLLLADGVDPRVLLIVGWIGGELVANFYVAVAVHAGTFSLSSPWLLFNFLSWVSVTVAALHPTWMAPMESRPAGQRGSRSRLVWLGWATALPVGTALVLARDDAVSYYAIITSLLVLALLLFRVSNLIVDLDEQRAWRADVQVLTDGLQYQALHDPLTGLANRTLLNDRIELALRQRLQTPGCGVAVLWLDIDGFKEVNDALGHDYGDQMLLEVTRRLGKLLRDGDTVARVGGDEFVVVLPEADAGHALEVGRRITACLAVPMDLGPSRLAPTSSLGIALSDGSQDRESLLKQADVAMYDAKEHSPGQCQVFSAELHSAVLARYLLATELKGAAHRGELYLDYQPVMDLANDEITGVEALVRWRHPQHGLLPPIQWIPLAEANGSICEIGAWVLAEACAQLHRWDAEHPEHPRLDMAINLSPRQLDEYGIVDRLRGILLDSDTDPARVVLEVTETALAADIERTILQLGEFKNLGFQIAIDDFGTGFSSLSFLRRLPLDLLKVDKAFVDGIARDVEEWAFTTAIVTLAHSLGKRVVAEGIETGEQLAHLIALHCRYGQGYLFSRPVSPEEISAQLRAAPRRSPSLRQPGKAEIRDG